MLHNRWISAKRWKLQFVMREHMTDWLGACLFNIFKLPSSSLFSIIWKLHLPQYFSSLHSLQNLIIVGITISLLKDFFQLLGKKADFL